MLHSISNNVCTDLEEENTTPYFDTTDDPWRILFKIGNHTDEPLGVVNKL